MESRITLLPGLEEPVNEMLVEKFDRLTSKCYANLIRLDTNADIWDKAYEVLGEIIHEGRSQNSSYVPELYLLDEETDYEYDVCGWLEDYLDYLDVGKQYEKLCKASSLGAEEKKEEALEFCEEWYQKEIGNILGATALIYARTATGDFEGANQIVEQYILEDSSCTAENDIVYIAAELFYKVSGNKKAEKRVSQAIKKYEEEVEAYFSDVDKSGLDFILDDINDEDLPFN